MEIQFQKNAVGYLKTVLRQAQKQEQTQQVRISDTMPDIGRVLGCWGQVMVRGKEWRGESAGVNGGVMAWVLYGAEGDAKPCCAEAWIPFQMKWDMDGAQQDGTMEVRTQLCHIDARMLSDRKLLVRATVGAVMHAMEPSSSLVYAPAKFPQDVQVLQRTYPMALPIEAGEKLFELDQSLEISSECARIDKLVRCQARPVLTEYKVVSDKLILRGNADIYVLYMDDFGKLHKKTWQLPFSQYTQLEGEHGPDAQVSVCFELTRLETEVAQADAVALKLGFTAQYVVQAQHDLVITEDMYCPGREVKPETDSIRLPTMLQRAERRFCAEAEMPEGMVLDVSFDAEMPKTQRREDQAMTELEGMFQIVYSDENGELQGVTQRWMHSVTDTVGVDADYWIQLTQQLPELQDMGIKAELQLETNTVGGMPLQQITGAQMGDAVDRDPQRPSLILRRTGTESLWEIAKSTGSTVDAIMKANSLQQEPAGEQILLIPVN